jgi:chromosome segregation ATPase
MARPTKYKKEDFYAYIEQQIAAGRRFREISPGELRDNVGAAYGRCAEILEEAQEDFLEAEAESAPTMPVWFRDFVTQLTEQTQQIAESQWLKVGRGINQSVEDATAVFEDRRAQFEKTITEQLNEIRALEDKVETLEEATAELDKHKAKIGELNNEVALLKERRAIIADQLSEEKSQRKLDQEELMKARQERDKLLGKLEALESKK